ncbi:MAG: right-handed parallel beta-helix repeat-containing protein [Candidatus Methanofastidiosa archaeon]|nr:right-handed parallel beta-helix repeat-containing protein [Candidatus Methanofastidiosa archaeon]
MFSPVMATMYDVVYVDDTGLGGNHFDTIEEALAHVNDEGTVHIAAGYYLQTSTLNITRDVTIIGEGQDVVTIEKDGPGSVFYVEFANLNISGCSIIGGSYGIFADLESYINIENCEIYDNMYDGIICRIGITPALPALDGNGYTDISISGCHIHDNGTAGIFIESLECIHVEIFENEINDNGEEGIRISANEGEMDCHIYENDIYKNGIHTNNTGIHIIEGLETDTSIEIFDCYIHEETGDGIHIEAATEGYGGIFGDDLDDTIYIYGNLILDCTQNGIYLGLEIDLYQMLLMDVQADGATEYDYFESDILILENELGGGHEEGCGIKAYMDVDLYDYPIEFGGADVYRYSTFTIAENEIYDFGDYGIDLFADVESISERAIDGEITITYIISSFAWITKNEIYANKHGGIALYDIPGIVTNNLIGGNYDEVDSPLDEGRPSAGMLLTFCDNILVGNNTIVDNVEGIEYSYSSPVILNNIIASNHCCGICYIENGSLPESEDGNFFSDIEYNDLWGNGVNYIGMPDQTGLYGNISEDPLFYGMHDARLLPISPCIDAGETEDMQYIVPDDIDDTLRPIGLGIDMGCYEMPGNIWSPKYVQPLATLSIAKANSMWGCIMENLPADLSPEAEALIEEIQALMGQAGSLANPVFTNGLMQQALSLMEELNEILGCGCHS